jgi:uncharacterized membrane protein YbjE (DUF340 family)
LTSLVFLVGISIGKNKDILKSLRSIGYQMLLVPLSVVFGSLIGSLAAGVITGLPANQSLAVGAGFGWYTLSAVTLTQLHSPALGALAFISNVLRELISVIMIPILASKVNYLAAVAPGGATTMDTTLPVISRCTDSKTTLIAFVNGVVLSSLVPVLVPYLLCL